MAATRASGAHGFTSTVVHPAAVARAICVGSAHPVRAITGRARNWRISSYPSMRPGIERSVTMRSGCTSGMDCNACSASATGTMVNPAPDRAHSYISRVSWSLSTMSTTGARRLMAHARGRADRAAMRIRHVRRGVCGHADLLSGDTRCVHLRLGVGISVGALTVRTDADMKHVRLGGCVNGTTGEIPQRAAAAGTRVALGSARHIVSLRDAARRDRRRVACTVSARLQSYHTDHRNP
jgi:hypothetical protein